MDEERVSADLATREGIKLRKKHNPKKKVEKQKITQRRKKKFTATKVSFDDFV